MRTIILLSALLTLSSQAQQLQVTGQPQTGQVLGAKAGGVAWVWPSTNNSSSSNGTALLLFDPAGHAAIALTNAVGSPADVNFEVTQGWFKIRGGASAGRLDFWAGDDFSSNNIFVMDGPGNAIGSSGDFILGGAFTGNLLSGTNLPLAGLRTNGAAAGKVPVFTGSTVVWSNPPMASPVTIPMVFSNTVDFYGQVGIHSTNPTTTVGNLVATGTVSAATSISAPQMTSPNAYMQFYSTTAFAWFLGGNGMVDLTTTGLHPDTPYGTGLGQDIYPWGNIYGSNVNVISLTTVSNGITTSIGGGGIFRTNANTGNAFTHSTTQLVINNSNAVVVTSLMLQGTGMVLTATGSGSTGALSISTNGTLNGNGSGFTNLNATELRSGTIADARLSVNVALLNAANAFTASNTIGSGGSLAVTGTGTITATSLNGSPSNSFIKLYDGAGHVFWWSTNGGTYNTNGGTATFSSDILSTAFWASPTNTPVNAQVLTATGTGGATKWSASAGGNTLNNPIFLRWFGALTAANTTNYMAIAGENAIASVGSSVPNVNVMPIARSMIFTNLVWRFGTAIGAGTNITLYLYTNSAATGFGINFLGDGSSLLTNTGTGSFTVPGTQGTPIRTEWQIGVTAGGSAASKSSLTCEYQ